MYKSFFLIIAFFAGFTAYSQDTITLPFIEDFSSYTGNPDTLKFSDEGGVYVNNQFGKNPKSRNVATFDGLDEFGIPYDQIPVGGNPNFPRNGEADYLLSLPINLDGLTKDDSTIFSFWWQKGGISSLLQPELDEGDSLKLYFLDKDSIWNYVWPLGDSKDTVITTPEGSGFQPDSVWLDSNYLHGGFRFMFKSNGTLTSNYDIWNINHIILDSHRTNKYSQDFAFGSSSTSILKNYYSMPYNQFRVGIESELADTIRTDVHSVYGVSMIVKDSTILVKEDLTDMTLDSTVTNVDPGIAGAYILTSGQDQTVEYYPNKTQIAGFLNTIDTGEEAYLLRTDISGYFPDLIDTNNTMSQTTIIDNYYAYDDGTAELGFGIRETGSIAVGFDLKEADQLRFLDLCFVRNGVDVENSTITLRVWRSLAGIDGATETETAVLTQVSLLFNDYELNKYYTFEFSTPVDLEPGRFYVGWDQINLTDRLLIGEDLSRNSFENVYQNIGGVWNQDWRPGTEEGSVMVRPYFGEKKSCWERKG